MSVAVPRRHAETLHKRDQPDSFTTKSSGKGPSHRPSTISKSRSISMCARRTPNRSSTVNQWVVLDALDQVGEDRIVRWGDSPQVQNQAILFDAADDGDRPAAQLFFECCR